MNKYPFAQANQVNAIDVVHWLGIPKARSKNKYACPFCGGSDPLHAYPDNGQKQGRGFKCFSCDVVKTNIDMVMEIHSVDAKEACLRIARQFGISHTATSTPYVALPRRDRQTPRHRPPKQLQPKPMRTRAEIMDAMWSQTHLTEQGRLYLQSRGIEPDCADYAMITSVDTVEQWRHITNQFTLDELKVAGWVNDEDEHLVQGAPFLMLPFFDGDQVIGFRVAPFGRYRQWAPSKYMSPRGERFNVPFLSWAAIDASRHNRMLYVVEGELDAVCLLQLGYSAIATCGSKTFNPDWLDQYDGIEGLKVFTDGDKAGQSWLDSIYDGVVLRKGVDWASKHFHEVNCPSGQDVNDLLKSNRLASLC